MSLFFDLGNPRDFARLADPLLALEKLTGQPALLVFVTLGHGKRPILAKAGKKIQPQNGACVSLLF
jgi:hypothetical protein